MSGVARVMAIVSYIGCSKGEAIPSVPILDLEEKKAKELGSAAALANLRKRKYEDEQVSCVTFIILTSCREIVITYKVKLN